ncbi:MAG: hypothetical protein NW703_05120 [Nitrospiraceae bacterium]
MRRVVALALTFLAGLSIPVVAGGGPHRFTVALPVGWQDAPRIHLVLEGVIVPGNRPLKLRVTTVTDEPRHIVLGSAGIVAVRPTMAEPRRLPSLLIDVTRSLKKLPRRGEGALSLTLDLQAVDGQNNPLTDLEWSVELVRFDTKGK